MKKLRISLILLCFVYSSLIFGQELSTRPMFVSIHTGGYLPTYENFKKIYKSSIVFHNGISIGIPITNQSVFVYGKLMYYRKKGVPIVTTLTYSDGQIQLSETQSGEIVISHYLLNLGVQYNYKLVDNLDLLFNGGVSFVKSDENTKNPLSDQETKGLIGFFYGLGAEKQISKLPTTVFFEIQYNADRLILKALDIKQGGTNINLGIRYYIKSKKPSP